MHPTANLACPACAGNGGCTLICRDFAARLGLVDASGRPKQSSVRLTTVRGVVAGASEQIPLMALSYELRGGSHSSAASAQMHRHALPSLRLIWRRMLCSNCQICGSCALPWCLAGRMQRRGMAVH